MTNKQLEIRSIASRAELEAVYDILGEAFPVGRDFFQLRLDHDSTYHRSTTWIAVQEDDITSTIQVFPTHCRLDEAVLKIGGIGSVATVPKYRGQGHCQQMLRRLTEWMEQEQYDLSLLYAVITPFYEKSNWEVVPETVYDLETMLIPAKNGAVNINIIPFEPAYADDIAGIYEQFNKDRTYSAIRPASYWQDRLLWPRWKSASSLLAIRDGVVVAYGVISETKEGGTAHLEELCYLDGEGSAAAVPLFQALCAQRTDAIRIQASLPNDHVLAEAFAAWGAVELTTSYAMWKVIRFQPLLAKLAAIFQKRLNSSKKFATEHLQLCIACEGQKAYFLYLNGQVTIEASARPDLDYEHYELSQQDFVFMLFHGYDSANPAMRHDIWRVLFPKQNSVFYNIDKF